MQMLMQMLLMPRMLDEVQDEENAPRWEATATVTPAKPSASFVLPR
jgi:hypothetical protein